MIVATGVLAYRAKMIARGQIRAARGLLDWTQAELAKAAGLSEVAVKNLERGRTDPRASTLTAIQEAFDRAGLVFLDPGDTRNGGSGVRLKI
jgi:transcriptional regulator with XRE-family HTH domain